MFEALIILVPVARELFSVAHCSEGLCEIHLDRQRFLVVLNRLFQLALVPVEVSYATVSRRAFGVELNSSAVEDEGLIELALVFAKVSFELKSSFVRAIHA